MRKRQYNILDELIVDNFAGGGGASTGIELALGRPVVIAINHDPAAIAMHEANHPLTRHFCESVWDIDPVKATQGRKVGLCWFSPDCKHFSKAKGGKPVEKKIRGLAWIVLRWAAKVKPRVIILENVEEFVTWGPVRKGRPVKAKQGETFRRWKEQLQALGYEIEHRELIAADYGAPTIRKRFFLIARCDGKQIIWPKPTHARDGAGGLKQWRSAAEIIDWGIPCPSIFANKDEIKEQYGLTAVRPLADNTLRRVARGVDKFVIKAAKPFIVDANHTTSKGSYDCFRGQDIADPLLTITGKHGRGLCRPEISPFTMTNTTNAVGTDARDPVNTARTGGGCGQMLVAPSLIQYHSEQSEHVRGQEITRPVLTVDAANRYGLAVASLIKYYGQGTGQELNEPAHTVTAKDREALAVAHMSKFFSGGYDGAGNTPADPLNTITAVDHNAIVTGHLVTLRNNMDGQDAREPIGTICTSPGHYGAIKTYLVKASDRLNLHRWPQVRELLNKYCDYSIADDEVLLLEIGGILWFIADIGLRMLTPRELYNANGFPTDYIIDVDAKGNEYKKAAQVARCGNAVPPPFAEALVRANLPELAANRKLETMEALNDYMAM